MTNPTETSADIFLKQLNTLNIQKEIVAEIKLLPYKTPELMIHYEKLYIQENINYIVLGHKASIARNAEQREKYKKLNPGNAIFDIAMRLFDEEDVKLKERERKQREVDINPDWDKYFLNRPLQI